MSLKHKLKLITTQKRSYTEGTVEFIGSQWVFFDDINDRAYQLEELEGEIEIFQQNKWRKGTIKQDGVLRFGDSYYLLQNGDDIRFPKKLTPAYTELLESLSEEAFVTFTHTLNQYSYSLFDCLYCHNFLSLLKRRPNKVGMNTIIFDNETIICTVQHHFNHTPTTQKDRFEITLSDGTRTLCENIG